MAKLQICGKTTAFFFGWLLYVFGMRVCVDLLVWLVQIQRK